MPTVSAKLPSQLSLSLSQPLSHHEMLHASAHGCVLYWEAAKDGNRWTKIQPGDPIAKLVAGFAGANDTYLTVNEFNHWRNVRLLRSLRCCYVDIDGMTDLGQALDALREAKMPPPSFVVFSGRGIHLYWLLEPVPAQALPVWQRIQDALIKALLPIGADPKARDCTRVLRLIGTRNGKNDAEVRGLVINNNVWTLHELANEVLGERKPKPSGQVFDFKAAGARKRKDAPRAFTGSIYDWWHLVYRDLITIADFHWFGGVEPGHRDQILFLMSVSLSWFAHPSVLKDEIAKTARTFTPSLTDEEVERQMSCVIARAQEASAGKKRMWRDAEGGLREVDPRYRFKAETMREWLGDVIAPELHGQLRALAPEEVIQQRKRERDAARYDRNREEYLRQHSESAEQRGATARLLKAQGKTAKEIADALGVSRASVFNYLKGV